VCLCLALVGCGQGSNTSAPDQYLTLNDFTFNPEAYQREALTAILKEATFVAQALKLPEKLPITETDLVEKYIGPPRVSQRVRNGIGTVTTTNYDYSIAVGNKFSFLTKRSIYQAYDQIKAQYRLPLSEVDTNAAYQFAVECLEAVSMDVKGLNRDCRLTVSPWTPGGDFFVPRYKVSWSKKAKPPPPGVKFPAASGDRKPVATCQFLLPTKTILQLRCNESEYILRKPVEIPNIESLLSQTNVPTATNALLRP